MKYRDGTGKSMTFLENMFGGDLELDEDSEFAIPRCVYIMLVKQGEKIIARPMSFFSEDAAVEYANKVSHLICEKIAKPVEIEIIQHGVEEQNAYRDLVGASWKKTVDPKKAGEFEKLLDVFDQHDKNFIVKKTGNTIGRGVYSKNGNSPGSVAKSIREQMLEIMSKVESVHQSEMEKMKDEVSSALAKGTYDRVYKTTRKGSTTRVF